MVASTGFDLSDFYSTCIGGLFMQLGAPDTTVAPLWDLFVTMGFVFGQCVRVRVVCVCVWAFPWVQHTPSSHRTHPMCLIAVSPKLGRYA